MKQKPPHFTYGTKHGNKQYYIKKEGFKLYTAEKERKKLKTKKRS